MRSVDRLAGAAGPHADQMEILAGQMPGEWSPRRGLCNGCAPKLHVVKQTTDRPRFLVSSLLAVQPRQRFANWKQSAFIKRQSKRTKGRLAKHAALWTLYTISMHFVKFPHSVAMNDEHFRQRMCMCFFMPETAPLPCSRTAPPIESALRGCLVRRLCPGQTP